LQAIDSDFAGNKLERKTMMTEELRLRMQQLADELNRN